MRLLVTGAAGMLGRRVVADARALGHDVTGIDLPDLDLTDAEATATRIAALAPEAIINCAAYTNVDAAEEHEDVALRVNGDAAGNLARAATPIGARLVHVSTDYVFDGAKDTPWLESDPPGPLGAYGRTKLAGEEQVAEAGGEYAIVRTAWLFGAGGPNFCDTMLRLASERDSVSVVTDQVGSPTWAGHLSPALIELAERRGDTGIFHGVGAGQCSWNELTIELFERAGVACRVLPTTSAEFRRPAPRPAWSVLGTERDPGVVLPRWEDGVQGHLDERKNA
ncbi:dTDP-4-dehydrorhamnose reductase [Paraconexibacter antarcticus]|uniref:dTDP-4-dehydrorhamnose reductase n=1 Tax=Paraconexibacter antarcticus TaxID=2949664 RepID=A0ABY5DQS4_9ACTN|nr:dTDP-4-dehydrorhamnose reductase [Paraconexibacter antarcticus]UTI64386.1 dTDP-4-dehydrorhamnose reductase [Paraconexibacter antarcticus]